LYAFILILLKKNKLITIMNTYIKLALCIAICLAVGFGSAALSMGSMRPWYDQINKPSWNPPSWIFGPVWTTLYIMMGIALWLVLTGNASNKGFAVAIFGIQLLLNFWWSPVFFKWHQMGWALAIIVTLWLAINLTIFQFRHTSRLASWLLVPYVAWVSFATLLNYTLWKLNS
jgi:translocator protein